MERDGKNKRWAVLLFLLAPATLHAAGPRVSAALNGVEGTVFAIVQFDSAVGPGEPDRILKEAGIRVVQNPDLLPNDRLVQVAADGLAVLAGIPEARAIYPASTEIAEGLPVRACAGSLAGEDEEADALFYAAGGWYNVLQRGAALNWNFGHGSRQLTQAVLRPIVERALAEWSRPVQLQFQYSPASKYQAITIEFFTGQHGDAYGFDGRGGALAHGFYPPPFNQEPIAGDIHFDDEEPWTTGGDPDLYSVILHEVGHALGLMHSAKPGNVMYPYYRTLDKLQEDDIQDLLRFFPARPPAPAAPPLLLDVATPPPVTAETIDVRGTLTGIQGSAGLDWRVGSTAGHVPGAATWIAAGLPLKIGTNPTTFTASDSAGRSASKSVVLTRNAPPPPNSDTVAPSLTIQSPSATVYGTSADKLKISGIAKDNVGVKEVSWQCGSATGIASGTTSWTIDMPLKVGDNQIIIRAKDEAGNTGWRSLLVTRR